MKSLIIIDRQLGIIDRKMRLLSRLNPLNAQNEKRKFFYSYARGREYNPIFRYKKPIANLPRLAEQLSVLSINVPVGKNERWFFGHHLENKRRRLIKKVLTLKYRGASEFTIHAAALFGRPKKNQINYAEEQLTPEASRCFTTIKDTLSATEAAEILQGHINKNLLPWRVRLRSSISSKAGLDSRSKYLLIKTNEKFAPEEVASLATHEIETHIFRKENGSLQKFPSLFGEGFAGPPTTEEGLAFFNETQGPHDPRRILIVSARTIATHLARTASFYKVFREMTARGLPTNYAWAIALRVKRGLTDTSQPGSFPKDHHYLKGYLGIKDFLSRDGNLRSLYIGKLNTGTVESIAKLGIETKEPRYLPGYLK